MRVHSSYGNNAAGKSATKIQQVDKRILKWNSSIQIQLLFQTGEDLIARMISNILKTSESVIWELIFIYLFIADFSPSSW